ncbi:hypothetical protein KAFR_0E00810 [Kazachstania africana CBS 2517]|uniref:Alkaline ceramidase n=1 Tax=Kazachstania africana (strain ATCC 22294 / BCRC 22015 / CBS 2517 / CECT 1963 / NBRC 1671 / NRRL Y-8276) TaxID=1071382 RepID=H2AV35_KAZAF|nr:hypothetical protein KAFR_0E00810 [Kazachstania africana CBS 2517]CCF58235.1 hypothetical protein KAFR_0E00810 [Kazachstania africana CBS 2517]
MVKLIWDYPDAQPVGYWGNTTAIIDWCEENYVISKYFAEWTNTLTNTVYFIVASYYIYRARKNKLETRFTLIGLGFGLVGFGSWLFHMTLKYDFQLLDELPMLYATAIPAWGLFCEFDWKLFRKRQRDDNKCSVKLQAIIAIAIFALVTLTTWIYIDLKIPSIFQIFYGILTVGVVIISAIFTYTVIEENKESELVKRNLMTTMTMGSIIFVMGFFCWQLDVHYCSFWRFLRRSYLHLPLGTLLELHGWWHILTGIGVYIFIVFLEYLRVLVIGTNTDYMFIWRWGIIPELTRNDSAIYTSFSETFWGPYVIEK